jgi:SAM domain (Sterile alpha motif)
MKSIGCQRLLQAKRPFSPIIVAARKRAFFSTCRLTGSGIKRWSWPQNSSDNITCKLPVAQKRFLLSDRTSALEPSLKESKAVDSTESDPLDGLLDCEDVSTLEAARTEGRYRSGFFTHLRSMLLQNEPSAKNVWTFMRTAPWMQKLQSSGLADSSERSLLSEALQLTVRQCFQLNATTISEVKIPRDVINLYRARNLMQDDEWAIALAALSKPLHEVDIPTDPGRVPDIAVLLFDTNLLLTELLLVWKSFFWEYQHYQSHGDEKARIWGFLKSSPAYNSDLSTALDYSTRFLEFIPRWPEGQNLLADRQMMCSSLITLSAIMKWFKLKIALQDSILSLDNSCRPDTDRPNFWSIENLSAMSTDELSFLHIMTHAANTEGTNFTILKLALAQMNLSATNVATLVEDLKMFRSSAGPALLAQEIYHTSPKLRAKDSVLTKGLIKAVGALLPMIQRPKNLELTNTAREICLRLKSKYPRYSSDLARMVCKAYWSLDSADQALEVVETFPELRQSKRLWVKALTYYYRQGDLSAFESVWRGTGLEGQFVPEEVWRMRLRIYHKEGKFLSFRQVFKKMYWLSRNDAFVSKSNEKPERTTRLTTLTFNMMIQLLLEDGFRKEAIETFDMLEKHPEATPNEVTYHSFFDHSLKSNNSDLLDAETWLRKMSRDGFEVSIEDCRRYLIHRLQMWPLSARWTSPRTILKAIGATISLRHGQTRPRHKTSNTNNVADITIPLSQANKLNKLSLVKTYQGLLDAIMTEIEPSRRLRLAVILVDYLQMVDRQMVLEKDEPYTDLKGFGKVVLDLIESSPRREQLALLSGDLYLSPLKNNPTTYENFRFVRTVWAMNFIEAYLTSLGMDEYREELRSIHWHGFHNFNQQTLFNAGIISTSARSRILLEVGKLCDEAAFYTNEMTKELRQEEARRRTRSIILTPGVTTANGSGQSPTKLLFPNQREKLRKIYAGRTNHAAHVATDQTELLKFSIVRSVSRAQRRGLRKAGWGNTTDPAKLPPPKEEGRERWLKTQVRER